MSDIFYKPSEDFKYENKGDCEYYHSRIAIPYGYGDSSVRISVFSWERNKWQFSLNGKSDKIEYSFKEEAAEGAIQAIKEMMAVLLSIDKEKLLSGKKVTSDAPTLPC